MFKKALLFLTANALFVALVIGVWAVGYEYDKANKVYLEREELSYDLGIYVYGKRWERVAKSLLALGLVIDAAVLLVWYRKRQSSDKNRLEITTTL